MEKRYKELAPPQRILLGPGPSNVDPRVLQAMSMPLVGHLDPYFLEIMDEVMELLRYVFKTGNRLTIPISGTGSAGMETSLINLVGEGDEVVVGMNGFFGQRMSEIVRRCGGTPIEVKEAWGEALKADSVEKALANSNAKVVALVHAETSTGVLQPLKEICKIVKKYDALLLADTVTSLGGVELDIDQFGVDISYSGTQKCLNCPPGLSPITLNEKTVEFVKDREGKIQSWYLDLNLIEKYWEADRFYHHTAPISMIYGLREALRIIYEEGLEKRWLQHLTASRALIKGLNAMGLETLSTKNNLPSLTAVKIPEGVTDAKVRKTLLNDFNIEIGGGLGDLKGKIWRIGLMGINACEKNVIIVLEALERTLRMEGFSVKPSEGIAAAMEVFEQ
ncbi:MAG: pyridoxal-phosphate-dependent aminotransferase family protein [Candidatus Jordarchaeum sp.]|uniref:pyridoxal-phosphate-dependent aminotransferase family protein n=1 Tax=Candidatus Jordarchaeum sp. TaxID=2823881 RepID=UPI00404985F5